jgi:hypothetical protein
MRQSLMEFVSAKAKRYRYTNNDLVDLEKQLQEADVKEPVISSSPPTAPSQWMVSLPIWPGFTL